MQVYVGIDWSSKKHDIVITDEKGKRLSAGVMAHSQTGFAKLDQMRERLGVTQDECVIGLETAHTILIDYLWQMGYADLRVIHPNIVNKSRERYCQSGAYDDQSDAFVISDLLRTDGHRFVPWQPGSPLLQEMRTTVSFAHFLTKQSTMQANRLEAVLRRYYPAARQLFSWPSQIACHFLLAYPTLEAARSLSYEPFCAFLKAHGHTQSGAWFKRYDLLQADYPQAAPAMVAAGQAEALPLAQMLLTTLKSKQQTLTQLQTLFQQHEDAPLFASLPRAGQLLAPALLVKFGEARARFPTAASVQMLAGTAPITKRSGKAKRILFRRACDKSFRYFVQQFALNSLKNSDWARAYFQAATQRGMASNHAFRCLGNRWLSIIWKMWVDRTPYDEAYHLQQRLTRRRAH